MPTQELAISQPPATENEENNVPSSQPIVGIIYPPPEVRSILCQEYYRNMKTTLLLIIITEMKNDVYFVKEYRKR